MAISHAPFIAALTTALSCDIVVAGLMCLRLVLPLLLSAYVSFSWPQKCISDNKQ